jgi:DNA polymerase III alpha subunit
MFVSLHNHSSYSLLDALSTPKQLLQRAKELNQPAIAITDHGTLACAWDAYKTAKELDVKLIIGIEAYFASDDEKFKHIILIAKNAIGYRNLLTLNKNGFDNLKLVGKKVYSVINWELLEKYSEGLICLTACGNGIVAQHLMDKNFIEAETVALRLKNIFKDDLALEVQTHNLKTHGNFYTKEIEQSFINRQIINLGKKLDIKVVPTTNSHYIYKEQANVQDGLLAISSHQTVYSNYRLKYNVPDLYVKSYEEVKAFFSRTYGEEYAEQLCKNSVEFAEKCEIPDWINPQFSNASGKELPEFPVKDEPDYNEFLAWKKDDVLDEDKQYLRFVCEKNLHKVPNTQEYKDRLEEELEVIEFHGFSSYMLIVADYVNWARKNGIATGTGRGCLTGETRVLTKDGFNRLDSVEIGDEVYTHTGEIHKVKNKFCYQIDEVGLSIKTDFSFDNINLTKDHKVYASTSEQTQPTWIKAEDLKIGDFIFMPFPVRQNKSNYILKKYLLSLLNFNKNGAIINTKSLKYALEIKEELLYNKIPCSILTIEDSYGLMSYQVIFNKSNNIKDNGYYCKITEINELKLTEVYDISVEKDTSYVTSNYAVHNSAGGSLIAYLTGIHCADPIKYNLIFARFHNKEKQSFPDIDLDFAPSGRDRVLNYLKNKYGEDRVAHVSNVNTITPKVYARDISRIFELGGSKEQAVIIGDTIADIIPSEIHSIDAAIKEVALFYEYGKKYPQLIDMKEINGKYRAWSTHAGGVIISKRSLVGLVPLRRDKDGVLCLEYDKVAAEDNGLVKMDILGLSTLDTIQLTYDLLKRAGKEITNDSNFDVYDEKTYNLLAAGDTFCVFQLGTSGGTMELCRGIKPKCIEDISHINALARPSSKEIRIPFIKAREKNEVKLLHPSLDRALSGTFGFGLYEECLMYLAADVAGWSLHKADGLRKLTKEKGKNPKKAKALLEGFMNDAIANGIEPDIAKEITYGIVSTFSGYGFNLSHSILYSMLSYQTAYLKAHFPTEFLLANLMQEVTSNSLNSEDNIKKIKEELRKHNISILPPNINESELHYTISDEKLLTGLNGLKFVGEDAIRDIIDKRPFKSFFDFMVRADTRKVRANTIQALAASGALDTFNLNRKDMYLYCQDYRKKLGVWLKKHNPLTEEFNYPWDNNKEWSKQELFALETKFIGESFICSLKEAYPKLFKEDYIKFKDIKSLENKSQIKLTKGIIKSLFEITIKKEGSKFYGKKMAKILLEDGENNFINLTIFPDRLEKINARMNEIHRGLCLVENIGLSFSASVNIYEDEPSLILNDLFMAYDIPALPKDLTAKKVTIKKEKSEQISIDDIESDLINEGLLSLDDD